MMLRLLRGFCYVTTIISILFVLIFGFSDVFREHYAKKIYDYYIGSVFNINKHYSQISLKTINHVDVVQCLPNMKSFLAVQFENMSHHIVQSSAEAAPERGIGVNLSYRIFEFDGPKQLFEGKRHLFDPPIPAQQNGVPGSRRVNLAIDCPKKPGLYQLRVEMVQEGLNWLSHLPGNNWIDKKMRVWSPSELIGESIQSSVFSQSLPDFSILTRLSDPWSFDDLEILEQAYRLARNLIVIGSSTLVNGEKNYQVANAGSIYPTVWGRDMNAIAKAQASLVKAKPLFSNHWAEMFLARQSDSDGIADWISLAQRRDGRAVMGKNTIQSDQELWVILSVIEAIERGDLAQSWFDQHIEGLTGAERLAQAINFILDQRFDKNQSCVWSGHTADWGDVGLLGKGEHDSTKIEHGSPKICGIFQQSLFVYTAKKLLKLSNHLSKPFLSQSFAMRMEKAMIASKRFAQTQLWQSGKQRGFFRIHSHLEKHIHKFDESSIFALGGNLMAIRSGIATIQQRRQIERHIAKLVAKGIPIGTVLIPSYPAGTFENPIMDEENEYQNGGDWDWYGGLAVSILADRRPEVAQVSLKRLAEKVVRNRDFSEWNRPNGTPVGSGNFQAGAAQFLLAVHDYIGAAERSSKNSKRAKVHHVRQDHL